LTLNFLTFFPLFFLLPYGEREREKMERENERELARGILDRDNYDPHQ